MCCEIGWPVCNYVNLINLWLIVVAVKFIVEFPDHESRAYEKPYFQIHLKILTLWKLPSCAFSKVMS